MRRDTCKRKKIFLQTFVLNFEKGERERERERKKGIVLHQLSLGSSERRTQACILACCHMRYDLRYIQHIAIQYRYSNTHLLKTKLSNLF